MIFALFVLFGVKRRYFSLDFGYFLVKSVNLLIRVRFTFVDSFHLLSKNFQFTFS
jgi:hypothetical protein